MRWRTVAVLLACALAAPASARAATVDGRPEAGPAFGPGGLVWGERTPEGDLRVLRLGSDGRRALLDRVPDPPARSREVRFSGLPGALSASTARVAYGVDRETVQVDGDSITSELAMTPVAFGSRGPAAPLLPGCRPAAYVTTAVDGDAVAVGLSYATCGALQGSWVWLATPGAAPRLVAGPLVGVVRQVRLVGGRLAYSEELTGAGSGTLRVVDLAAGTGALELPPDALGGDVERFALDADGTLAALVRGRGCHATCLVVRSPAGALSRVSTRAAYGLDLRGGRVAFFTQRGLFADRLVVADAAGRVIRRLDRFGRSRNPLGDPVLAAGQVGWAVRRGDLGDPSAPGSLRTAHVP